MQTLWTPPARWVFGVATVLSLFSTLQAYRLSTLNIRESIDVMLAQGAPNPIPLLAVALLVFAGAMGKSAQFPLHVWLPDAMDGPTPLADRALIIQVKRLQPRWLSFAVIDRGPGIPQEVARQLFTPFFTTRTEGMGLGLSLCRTVVEQHGGALVFETLQSDDGACVAGTRFTFTLPRAPAGGATNGANGVGADGAFADASGSLPGSTGASGRAVQAFS